LHVHRPHIHAANRAGNTGASIDGNDVPITGKTNPATEEQFNLPGLAHREKARVFQEEGAFFRKENAAGVADGFERNPDPDIAELPSPPLLNWPSYCMPAGLVPKRNPFCSSR
jgi:hypothetical protein